MPASRGGRASFVGTDLAWCVAVTRRDQKKEESRNMSDMRMCGAPRALRWPRNEVPPFPLVWRAKKAACAGVEQLLGGWGLLFASSNLSSSGAPPHVQELELTFKA